MNAAVYLLGAAVLLLAILRKTHGHFTYCLDDPYIHLALAQRLRHGLYGLNAGEPASPSSSILWPLLFVPFTGTALLRWMPLVFNIAFSTATAWLLGHVVDRFYVPLGRPDWRARTLALLLLLATNIFGLTYTGLEHPLQVLLCVASAFAILHVLEGRHIPRWSILAAALLPSIRYEGLLITFAVAVALWGVRARRSAIALLPASLVLPAIFSAFLHSLKLPLFPLSVLVKSSYKFQDHSSPPIRVARLLVETLLTTLRDPERAPQLLLVIALTYMAWRARHTRAISLALAGTALAGVVQVVLGPVGWFFRYEIYCLAFTLLIALAADARIPAPAHPNNSDLGSHIRAGLHLTSPDPHSENLPSPRQVPGLMLLLLAALAMLYARPQLGIPQAALGIYQQQAQLGRFASEYVTAPVAVNDLGLVSFDRTPDQYVLDLYGLGSYETFKTPAAHRNPAWLDAITREHSIGLVMVYPEWFSVVPAGWAPIAKLCANDVSPTLGAGSSRVMFYATALANQPQLLQQLASFRRTLPAGSVLQLHPTDTSTTCTP